MTDLAIKVERLSKRYRLGAGPQGKGDFRDAVRAALRRVTRRMSSNGNGNGNGNGEDRTDDPPRDLWALKNVNLEVRRGEALGVIGHNGAGKSTLLKILSRITDPTEGEAWYEGRLGSLLEVGTGFHPELSGRENIYLNGTILGMTRREIEAKFDQIVEFSEIGRFLETPVKRYSSGMYVRLAFSVAAHLDPEVLIVDEVLAVGDAAFQRKCIDKMKEVSASGRTILFVSHNMGSVQALCDRAVVLKSGEVIGEGSPKDAIALYLQSATEQSDTPASERTERRGRGNVRITDVAIFNEGHEDSSGLLIYGQNAIIRVDVSAWMQDLACVVAIYDDMARLICRFHSRVTSSVDAITSGRRFICEIPELPLVPGRYHINVALNSSEGLEDHLLAAQRFEIERGTLDGRRLDDAHLAATIAPRHRWTVPGASS